MDLLIKTQILCSIIQLILVIISRKLHPFIFFELTLVNLAIPIFVEQNMLSLFFLMLISVFLIVLYFKNNILQVLPREFELAPLIIFNFFINHGKILYCLYSYYSYCIFYG